MTDALTFGLEDIVRYFSETKPSDIYRSHYGELHGSMVPDVDQGVAYKGYLIWNQLTNLYTKSSTTPKKDFPNDLYDFGPRTVGSPLYTEIADEFRKTIGEDAEPLLREHQLLCEYARSSDVVLLTLFATISADIPAKIKRKVHHRDVTAIKEEDFNGFVEWLEHHPESNALHNMEEALRESVERFYGRIVRVHTFYSEHSESPDVNKRARGFVYTVNRLYTKKTDDIL